MIFALLLEYLLWNNICEIDNTYKILNKYKNGIVIRHLNKKIFIETNTSILSNYVYVKGYFNTISNDDFLIKLGIRYQLNTYVIENIKIDNFTTLIESIINKNNLNSKEFINMFILGKKNNDSTIYTMLKDLNLLHLFVISGFHFWIITYFLNKILFLIKLNKYFVDYLIFFVLLMYLSLLNFQLSALRSFIYLFLLRTFQLLKIKVNNIDTFIIMACILSFIDINQVITKGYILSMLLSFAGIVIANTSIKYKKLVYSLLCYVLSVTILSNSIKVVNIFGYFYQLLFGMLIPIYYCYTLMFFWFVSLNNLLFELLKDLLLFAYDFSLFIQIFYIPFFYVLIYYLLLMLYAIFYKFKNSNV
ncbi:MAG0480 family ComEC-like protein [Mycoplasma phocoenae]|uniref:ComEC/Rec2-related protein domain-containing protein n=1 Tax=Mycoplasma phocoenae TaxID=754517 RepID=A0A858U4W1_9MOLU|nr:ComEC/Rec2 family competence protein [Mycoplasma phocoenae]QJG67109.1 hypothetical protein HGG69_02175 [Mycoplasma phocoenae]